MEAKAMPQITRLMSRKRTPGVNQPYTDAKIDDTDAANIISVFVYLSPASRELGRQSERGDDESEQVLYRGAEDKDNAVIRVR